VLRDFIGADPDETTISWDCKGVSITLEEWVSVEFCIIVHRRICKERILQGIVALNASLRVAGSWV
jgi:hypothetical protein